MLLLHSSNQKFQLPLQLQLELPLPFPKDTRQSDHAYKNYWYTFKGRKI